METSTAAASLGVALTLAKNISSDRSQESVFVVANIHIDPNESVIVEYEADVVIVSIRYRLNSGSERRPCIGVGRGSRFSLKGLHRNFAVCMDTYPLVKLFQGFGNVFILTH